MTTTAWLGLLVKLLPIIIIGAAVFLVYLVIKPELNAIKHYQDESEKDEK